MPLHKDESNLDSLFVVNEKINEIKKKIQLSEGQRKAHFEECDTEKKRNVETIHVLKKEVKEIYKKLAEPSFCKESVLKTSSCYPKDVAALRNKKLEEAIEFMDLKCIDLNKQLDVFKFRNKLRKMKLKKIAEEYRDQMKKFSNTKSRKVETVSNKPVCVLENQIHRIEMNMMEAEHVNKKYKTIRLQLLSDSVEFESSLKKLEEEIRRQNIEIKHLEIVNKEAFGLRDITKGTLLRHEILALNAGKARDHQLVDFRHRVEERKLELERLERRIFPAGKVVFDESGDGAPVVQATNETTNRLISQLEGYFTKLKLATGETETEEVLTRFLFQKETKRRLDFLKKITEEEKKQLELRKEMSLAELEAFKFADVKDKEESQEELEKTKNAIEFQKSLKEKYMKEVKRIKDQLSNIANCLISVIDDFQDVNVEPVSDSLEGLNAYINVLECLIRKIKSGFSKIGLGENMEDTLKNLKSSQYRYLIDETSLQMSGETILFPGLMQQDEGKQPKAQQSSLLVPETEDEEDVLSRSHLKRQAQLIVDAKSRKKFNRVINIPRTKK